MLKKLSFLAVLCSIMLLNACKSGYSPEVQKLYDEVMEIHDEVMPEMGTIHKLKKQLKTKLESDKGNLDTEDINNNIAALDYADEEMMAWMHQFKVPKKQKDATLLKYLKDQKIKITKVNVDMKTSIKNAKIAVDAH